MIDDDYSPYDQTEELRGWRKHVAAYPKLPWQTTDTVTLPELKSTHLRDHADLLQSTHSPDRARPDSLRAAITRHEHPHLEGL